MAEQLTIESSNPSPDQLVLKLSGALVLTTIFQFQNIVRADATAPLLVVDMTDVKYCDSAGIGALVNAHVSRSRDGRKIILKGVSPRVMEALKVTRVDQLFEFIPAETAATGT